jgi:hypothetical protein
MDSFLKMLNGEIAPGISDNDSGEEENEFELEDDENEAEDDEGEYDDAEFYELGDMEFSAESTAVSGLNIEKILENADIPYEVKLDYEFISNLRKMFKMVSRDFDYVSYDGGKNVTERREIDVNGFDFTLETELSRNDDHAPFVLTVRLTRK